MAEFVKLVFTVPEAEAEKVRQVLGDIGAGTIGNYSHTSFSVKGTGRFIPTQGANPTIGKVGKTEEVAEERVEITCGKEHVTTIIDKLKEVHPYEVPVIDVYPLLNP